MEQFIINLVLKLRKLFRAKAFGNSLRYGRWLISVNKPDDKFNPNKYKDKITVQNTVYVYSPVDLPDGKTHFQIEGLMNADTLEESIIMAKLYVIQKKIEIFFKDPVKAINRFYVRLGKKLFR